MALSGFLGIRAPFQVGATLHEIREGFGIIEQDADIGHLCVVSFERLLSTPGGREPVLLHSLKFGVDPV
jgi:hypothetical protein